MMEERNPEGPLGASITGLHGFFTSVVSGPMVAPSEWMPVIFGDSDDRVWESVDQARRAMNTVMRFYNEVATDLRAGDRFSIMIDRIGEEPDAVDLADDWCKGYLLGASLRDTEWEEAMEDPELSPAFLPMLGIVSPEEIGLDPGDRGKYDEMLELLPECAIEIHAWWRKKFVDATQSHSESTQPGTVRRAAPKIQPNTPCPCGSGKKYKRCCAPLRAT